jgi:hypothetical protein
MVNLKYGKIHCDVEWQWPTLEIFNQWKKDFISIPNIHKYDVYVLGRFVDVLNGQDIQTADIDIILIGANVLHEIEDIIYQATKLGIEKYNVYFDVQWHSELFKYSELDLAKSYMNTVYMHSNQWIVNGKILSNYQNAKQISENLWSLDCHWPTWKQKQRIEAGYTYHAPVKIC